jgi:hypothetical protein
LLRRRWQNNIDALRMMPPRHLPRFLRARAAAFDVEIVVDTRELEAITAPLAALFVAGQLAYFDFHFHGPRYWRCAATPACARLPRR